MNTRIFHRVMLGSALTMAFAAFANADGPTAMHSLVGGGTDNAFVVALGATASAAAATECDSICVAIKANVHDIVSGINTHNAKQATMHDAPTVVVIESGQPNTVGIAADLAGFKQAFAAAPTWRVSRVEETVDVPQSGDMAIYRSVYNQASMHDNLPFTQKVNFISGWSRHENGSWMMDWYAVSEMEKSHKQ